MSPDGTNRRQFVTTVGLGGVLLAGAGVATASGSGRKHRNFRAHLSGDGVVPPVDTDAQGQATFKLRPAADAIDFKLNVANVDDVIGAHVHHAPPGENGSIVVFLYGDPFAEAVTVNGTLAEGTITADDVIGPFDGDFDALVTAIADGEASVQVHTKAHPPGEIRGQIH